MIDWSQHIYALTEGARRAQERAAQMIERARDDLRERRERAAADALDTMLADDPTRLEILNAMTSFEIARWPVPKVRQGDLCADADDLRDMLRKLEKMNRRLVRHRDQIDNPPGAPDPDDLIQRGHEAFEAVARLAVAADAMHRATVAAHKADVGGKPALSERLAGDPLDNLADALAEPWRRHGPALSGASLTAFVAMLRAMNEAATEEQDLPERAVKRIRSRLLDRTEPPPKI